MILKTVFKAQAPCGTHHSDAVEVFPFLDFMNVELVGSAFFLLQKRHCERSEAIYTLCNGLLQPFVESLQ